MRVAYIFRRDAAHIVLFNCLRRGAFTGAGLKALCERARPVLDEELVRQVHHGGFVERLAVVLW